MLSILAYYCQWFACCGTRWKVWWGLRRLFNPRGLSAAGWEADTLEKSEAWLMPYTVAKPSGLKFYSVVPPNLLRFCKELHPWAFSEQPFKSAHRLHRWLAAASFILIWDCESRVATKTATDSQVYGAVVPCASTGWSFEDHARGQTSGIPWGQTTGIPFSWQMRWKVFGAKHDFESSWS